MFFYYFYMDFIMYYIYIDFDSLIIRYIISDFFCYIVLYKKIFFVDCEFG